MKINQLLIKLFKLNLKSVQNHHLFCWKIIFISNFEFMAELQKLKSSLCIAIHLLWKKDFSVNKPSIMQNNGRCLTQDSQI